MCTGCLKLDCVFITCGSFREKLPVCMVELNATLLFFEGFELTPLNNNLERSVASRSVCKKANIRLFIYY